MFSTFSTVDLLLIKEFWVISMLFSGISNTLEALHN